MKFKANTRRKAIEYEKDLVRYWKENRTFEKSVEQRPKEGAYVFYDGPPFITGVPHHGTLPVSYTHLRAHETVLDLVCRLLLEKKKTY